ncbi:Gfo/Idh/MocA family protein [Tuwongella immobilis]|uniref:Gfo/Idh/MocA-like oxidoreductase N-terminal domain-containing protein n=1 Tax=Tuwongella immobilis TaxID=692036 RepID=A0A6C2YWL3_9BACT|nr:Gfo/Idh/MocA family oxidoreductase [Tuwongella immobilis]VIP05781.1 oxidoreductase domain protein : Oxidoreductase domain protein OS=Pirellula staleyi (strain ATCC 27377 / DSM 6068 / ICPB 4128) GN=Psta_3470 PE=4 SV=1: GFO_IDH_MocA [Tuwongella immobilis]VTS08918.1 oxidoreductase domain protein : Oxidoreductase domain protein OS=Pirellula staleyi (strain ATCC 27377 / DSM 6068 / ICPB 4128) GN=Psta_3470 PE=4 SV=1: GFO_IDH_MocA [Tuwongella immobilis]
MTAFHSLNRRTFTRTVFVGGLALALPNVRAAGPNDRLNLAFVGVGTMGRGHLGGFLGMPDVQVVAVCDVVNERSEAAQKSVNARYASQRNRADYHGCEIVVDYRKLLDRKDIDAVVIATPDHWHALPAVHFAQAGKHIYCEKPLTRTIGEGKRIIDAVKKSGIVFQTGSQQRTEFGGKFRIAMEFIRAGALGDVKTVRVGVGAPNKPCDLPEQPIPAGTDWDRWLGPAPKRGYNEILCPKGVHGHFPAWRNYREYAGGGLADMGAHHFDIAQWALGMDDSGPVTIESPAGNADSGLRYVYANGIEMFHGGPSGCTFEGTLGKLYVDRGVIQATPAALLEQFLAKRGVSAAPTDHKRDWIDCIRKGGTPACPASVGHRSATVCHLGNIGYQLRRKLTWDPVKEQFVNDDAANALVDPAMREGWAF